MLLLLLLLSLPLFVLAESCVDEYPAPVPNNRFILYTNGTVRDTATGLMWKQCTEGMSGVGCAVGDALTFKWKWALRQGGSSNFAGYADWRLPNQTELLSLLQRRCYGHDIDVVHFPRTPADRFWTATPSSYYQGAAWTIHFGTGAIDYATKRDSAYVRLVRDSAACSPISPATCLAHPQAPSSANTIKDQAPPASGPLSPDQ